MGVWTGQLLEKERSSAIRTGHTRRRSLAHVAELLEPRHLCAQRHSVRPHFQQREAIPWGPALQGTRCACLTARLRPQAQACLRPAAGGSRGWKLLQSRRLLLQQLLQGQRKRLRRASCSASRRLIPGAPIAECNTFMWPPDSGPSMDVCDTARNRGGGTPSVWWQLCSKAKWCTECDEAPVHCLTCSSGSCWAALPGEEAALSTEVCTSTKASSRCLHSPAAAKLHSRPDSAAGRTRLVYRRPVRRRLIAGSMPWNVSIHRGMKPHNQLR